MQYDFPVVRVGFSNQSFASGVKSNTHLPQTLSRTRNRAAGSTTLPSCVWSLIRLQTVIRAHFVG